MANAAIDRESFAGSGVGGNRAAGDPLAEVMRVVRLGGVLVVIATITGGSIR